MCLFNMMCRKINLMYSFFFYYSPSNNHELKQGRLIRAGGYAPTAAPYPPAQCRDCRPNRRSRALTRLYSKERPHSSSQQVLFITKKSVTMC